MRARTLPFVGPATEGILNLMQQGLVDDDCLFALVSEPGQGSEFDLLSGQGLG